MFRASLRNKNRKGDKSFSRPPSFDNLLSQLSTIKINLESGSFDSLKPLEAAQRDLQTLGQHAHEYVNAKKRPRVQLQKESDEGVRSVHWRLRMCQDYCIILKDALEVGETNRDWKLLKESLKSREKRIEVYIEAQIRLENSVMWDMILGDGNFAAKIGPFLRDVARCSYLIAECRHRFQKRRPEKLHWMWGRKGHKEKDISTSFSCWRGPSKATTTISMGSSFNTAHAMKPTTRTKHITRAGVPYELQKQVGENKPGLRTTEFCDETGAGCASSNVSFSPSVGAKLDHRGLGSVPNDADEASTYVIPSSKSPRDVGLETSSSSSSTHSSCTVVTSSGRSHSGAREKRPLRTTGTRSIAGDSSSRRTRKNEDEIVEQIRAMRWRLSTAPSTMVKKR